MGERRLCADDRLWSVEDVSYFLDVPVQTVYAWRGMGVGPPGRRVGKRLRYRPEDVRSWVDGLSTEVAS
jgi:DNA-binding transcriptional MerR regulator